MPEKVQLQSLDALRAQLAIQSAQHQLFVAFAVKLHENKKIRQEHSSALTRSVERVPEHADFDVLLCVPERVKRLIESLWTVRKNALELVAGAGHGFVRVPAASVDVFGRILRDYLAQVHLNE